MIAQQKALNGNAVTSDACEANRRAPSRVQQYDCVVGTQRNDVLFLDWPKRAQGDGPIGQTFLFVFIEVLPAWLAKLNGLDPPQVTHGSGITCAGHDAFQSLTKLHMAGFLTNQNAARSDGKDNAGGKFYAKQHAVKLAIELGGALLHDEHARFAIEVNPVQARGKALEPNGRARGCNGALEATNASGIEDVKGRG